MCISAIHGEIRMRQGASRPIERVTISVFSSFKPNFDVNLSLSFLFENEICLVRPNLERLGKLNVHFCMIQTPWIFGDLVRQLLHSPPTALQCVSLATWVAGIPHFVSNSTPRQAHGLSCLSVQFTCDIKAGKSLEFHNRFPQGICCYECTRAWISSLRIQVAELREIDHGSSVRVYRSPTYCRDARSEGKKRCP